MLTFSVSLCDSSVYLCVISQRYTEQKKSYTERGMA